MFKNNGFTEKSYCICLQSDGAMLGVKAWSSKSQIFRKVTEWMFSPAG